MLLHSFKREGGQTIAKSNIIRQTSIMNLSKLSFISILAATVVAADTTGGLRHQPVLTPDAMSSKTASLLRANQKKNIGLSGDFRPCAVTSNMFVEINILLDYSDNRFTRDDRISWQIVNDCGSPLGFHYDATSGDVKWQDCIPPSMYVFTMWNEHGWSGRGQVEIIVDGVVVYPLWRHYEYWQDVSFGASSCPTEHAEVARTMI